MSVKNPNPKTVAVQPTKSISELTAQDLPSEELMNDLGIEPAWYADFHRAMNFVVANASGMNITQAAESAQIDRQALYNAKWQGLVNAARRLLIGRAMLSAQSATLRVFEMYPQIIEKLLQTAMYAKRDGDSNDAIELINEMFIEKAPQQRDVSEESKYLKSIPNFNPALPMHIDINVNVKNPPAFAGGDGVDVTVDAAFNRGDEMENPETFPSNSYEQSETTQAGVSTHQTTPDLPPLPQLPSQVWPVEIVDLDEPSALPQVE